MASLIVLIKYSKGVDYRETPNSHLLFNGTCPRAVPTPIEPVPVRRFKLAMVTRPVVHVVALPAEQHFEPVHLLLQFLGFFEPLEFLFTYRALERVHSVDGVQKQKAGNAAAARTIDPHDHLRVRAVGLLVYLVLVTIPPTRLVRASINAASCEVRYSSPYFPTLSPITVSGTISTLYAVGILLSSYTEMTM